MVDETVGMNAVSSASNGEINFLTRLSNRVERRSESVKWQVDSVLKHREKMSHKQIADLPEQTCQIAVVSLGFQRLDWQERIEQWLRQVESR